MTDSPASARAIDLKRFEVIYNMTAERAGELYTKIGQTDFAVAARLPVARAQ